MRGKELLVKIFLQHPEYFGERQATNIAGFQDEKVKEVTGASTDKYPLPFFIVFQKFYIFHSNFCTLFFKNNLLKARRYQFLQK